LEEVVVQGIQGFSARLLRPERASHEASALFCTYQYNHIDGSKKSS
jgi:hypothetical protein